MIHVGRVALATLGFGLIAAAGAAAAEAEVAATEERPRIELSFKGSLASFYDTNVHRSYSVKTGVDEVVRTRPVEEDIAARLLLHAAARGRVNPQLGLSADYDLGAKIFARVEDENVWINKVQGRVDWRPLDVLGVSLGGQFKDKTQRGVPSGSAEAESFHGGRRDYRSGDALLALGLHLSPVTLVAAAGYRGYRHKPEYLRAYSFDEGSGRLTAYLHFLEQHRLGLSYQVDARTFEGDALDEFQASVLRERDERRRDWVHSLELGYRWRGPLLLDLGYTLEVDRSNSYGESYLKHRASLMASAKLPGEVLLTLLGRLQFKRLDDGHYVSGLLPIGEEDENQNSVAVKLSRQIASWLSAEMQVSHFRNEFSGSELRFSRTTVAMAVAGRWE